MRKILLTIVAVLATALNVNAADEPTYTATGNTTSSYTFTYDGKEYSYYSSNASAPSLSNLSVEVYEESKTIIVRNWWGVEGYDMEVAYTSAGYVDSCTPIVNGVSNPYVAGGYSYVDTGVDNVLAYIYNSYCSYFEDNSQAYLYLGLYYGNNWGYYLISWTVPESTGISKYIAAPEAENAPCYNLAGQRVAEGTKGVLIKNGKKFIQR